MVDVAQQLHLATSLMDANRNEDAAALLLRIVQEDDPANPWAIRLLRRMKPELPEARRREIARALEGKEQEAAPAGDDLE